MTLQQLLYRLALGTLLGLSVATLAAAAEPEDTAEEPPADPNEGASDAPPLDLPPGHPDVSGMNTGDMARLLRPRSSTVTPDSSLPPGSVEVVVLDAEDTPVAEAPIALSYLRQGSKSAQRQGRTSAEGSVRFDDLPVGREIAYRATTERQAARYASQPFTLDEDHGMRVLLHAYEATSNLQEVQLDTAVTIVIELEEDGVSIDHIIQILNVGKVAWVPHQVLLRLPPDHQAFRAAESMTGVAATKRPDGWIELTGTFPPGSTDLSYSYTLPLDQAELSLVLSLPPRTSEARVIAAANPGLALRVAGFPPAQLGRLPDGKRILATEARASSDEGLDALHITLEGLPEPSQARWIAVLLALGLAVGGAWIALRARPEQLEQTDLQQARDVILGELVEIEHETSLTLCEQQAVRAALVEALSQTLQRLKQPLGTT